MYRRPLSLSSLFARPNSLAVRISDVVEQRTPWLEHPREVLVKSGPVHVGRLAQGAGRWIVNNRGELAVFEAFNKLSHIS